MSTQYDGIPGNCTVPAALSITAATNAAPIAITTAAAHGMTTGDAAHVNGVYGNTAANGTWTVTVTGSSTLTLNTSAGNGAFNGSFGTPTIQSLGFGATYAVPSDGDARSAASVNVALSALGDRTSCLAGAVGQYKYLAPLISAVDNDVGYSNWEGDQWAIGTLLLPNAWYNIGGISFGVPPGYRVQQGDVLDVTFTGSVNYIYTNAGSAPTTPGASVSLGAAFSAFAGSFPAPTKISGSAQVIPGSALTGVGGSSTVTVAANVHLRGFVSVPASVEACQLTLLAGTNDSVVATNLTKVQAFGDYQFAAAIYRPTFFVSRNG